MTMRAQIQALTNVVGRDYLSFRPAFVELTGSINAAVFLSQCIYWTQILHKTGKSQSTQGWFWKSQQEWSSETCLSRREQESARSCLVKLGVLEEKRAGMPARMYFRVNTDVLGQRLASLFGIPYQNWNWTDVQLTTRLLGTPVLVIRHLADICNSIPAGLYLSYLLNQIRKDNASEVAEQTWRMRIQHQAQLCLKISKRQAELARQKLREAGLISEQLTSTAPPKLATKVNFERLLACLGQYVQNRKISNKHSSPSAKISTDSVDKSVPKPLVVSEHYSFKSDKYIDVRVPNIKMSYTLTSNFPQSAILNITKAPYSFSAFTQSSMAERGNSLIREKTTSNNYLQTSSVNQREPEIQSDEVVVGHERLIFHACFTERERIIVRKQMSGIRNEVAQQILDESAWQIAFNRSRKSMVINRVMYVQRLIDLEGKGEFVPKCAHLMADLRIQEQARLNSLKALETEFTVRTKQELETSDACRAEDAKASFQKAIQSLRMKSLGVELN